MKPIENIFGFDCGTCEYNRHCYGGNMGNQFRYCEKSAKKIQNLDNLEKENKKQKEVIDKITAIINYYGVDNEYNDNITLRHILKDMLDIIKEVSE